MAGNVKLSCRDLNMRMRVVGNIPRIKFLSIKNQGGLAAGYGFQQ